MRNSCKYLFVKTILVMAMCSGLTSKPAAAQNSLGAYNSSLFTTPLTYTAAKINEAIIIDGALDEDAWKNVAWSEYFTDIEGAIKPKPLQQTRIKLLWDDTCIYIAAELKEKGLQASLHQHDTIVFQDNDFEIFIDPDNDTHNYFEIEVNALNTIFDLFMPKPYRNNGDALIAYDVPGLQSAVQLYGSLQNKNDVDSGWAVEMAIPFRALNFGFRKNFTPAEGSFYRINFSRVEWNWDITDGKYIKSKDAMGKNLHEQNWVWSPQGVINMHYPERWGYLFFGNGQKTYSIPATEEIKNYLWLVYYKQQDYYKQHHMYATTLAQIHMVQNQNMGNVAYTITMQATANKFEAIIKNKKVRFRIDEEGLIKKL